MKSRNRDKRSINDSHKHWVGMQIQIILLESINYQLTSIHLLDSTSAGSAFIWLLYFCRSSRVLRTLLSAVGTRADEAIDVDFQLDTNSLQSPPEFKRLGFHMQIA